MEVLPCIRYSYPIMLQRIRQANSPHLTAVLQALFVTFLWSTSWVLIKFGLEDIPALTFAGLRYMLAFLFLLPFLLRQPAEMEKVRHLPRQAWLRLIALGVLLYAVTQGAQFVALANAPAVTVTLLWNFTAVVVALLGIRYLLEVPTKLQWGGMALALLGAFIYFYPIALGTAELRGVLAALVGLTSNAFAAVLGRYVNKDGSLRPLTVTAISMGTGAMLLLAAGISAQGLPRLSWQNWLIILWLAVVNTAVAFTLWNRTLRVLSAMESTIINNTMTIQIAILAVLFLGESLNAKSIAGLALAVIGTFLVQWRKNSQ